MCFVIGFITFFEWIFLTVIRGHYIIDLVAGLVVARVIHRMSEGNFICWIADVKLCGYPL